LSGTNCLLSSIPGMSKPETKLRPSARQDEPFGRKEQSA